MGLFSIVGFIKRHYPTLYQSIRVNLRRGQLNCSDITLPSSDVFTLFSLPFKVSAGSISHLSLRGSLRSASVSLTARGVRLVLKQTSLDNATFAAFVSELHALKQQEILKHFANEQKNDDENDSDNIDGPASKSKLVLMKFLPLLLHRVQLDLRDIDIEIQFANNVTIHLSLASLITTSHKDNRRGAPSQADFAKTFVVKHLCITGSTGLSNQNAFQLSLPYTQIMLTLVNARYDVEVLFRHESNYDPLSIHVASLLPFVSCLKTAHLLWQIALQCKRPLCTIAQDRRAWLQYAVCAALKRRQPSRSPVLSIHTATSFMRNCIRYYRLYLQHLESIRNNTKLHDSSTAEELDALERHFDVKLIIILRSSARKRLLAERLTSSIAKSTPASPYQSSFWSSLPQLSFLNFHRSFSSESDEHSEDNSTEEDEDEKQLIISEIYSALSAIEPYSATGSTSVANQPASYARVPRARVCILSPNLAVHFTGLHYADSVSSTGLSSPGNLRCILSNVVTRAEFESDLDSYNLSLSIGHANVRFNDNAVFRSGVSNERVFDSPVHYSSTLQNFEPLINISVSKRALDQHIHFTFKTQPFSLVVPIDVLRQLCHFTKAQIMPLFDSEKGTKPLCDSTSCPPQSSSHAAAAAPTMSMNVELALCDILIVDTLPGYPTSLIQQSNVYSRDGLLIRLCTADVRSKSPHSSSSSLSSLSQSHIPNMSTAPPPIEYLASTSLHIITCKVERGRSNELYTSRLNGLLLDSTLTALKTKDSVSVDISNVTAKLNICAAVQLLKLINELNELYVQASFLFPSSPPALDGNAESIDREDASSNASVLIQSKSMHVELYDMPSRNNLLWDGGIKVIGSDVCVKCGSGQSYLSVRHVSITENVYGGKCSISPLEDTLSNNSSSSRIPASHGMFVKLMSPASSSSGFASAQVDASAGQIAIFAPLESVTQAFRFATRVTDLMDVLRQTQTANHANDSLNSNHSVPTKSSFIVHSIILQLASPHGIHARLKDLSLNGQGPILDITCGDFAVWHDDDDDDDLNRAPFMHSHIEPSSNRHFTIVKKLSHSIESKVVSNDHALSITITPNVVNFHLSNFEFSLSPSVLQRLKVITESLSNESSPDQDANDDISQHGSNSSQSSKIMVRGSNLSLRLVEEPLFVNAFRFDIPQSTAIFSSSSEIISLRKLSVLTNTNISSFNNKQTASNVPKTSATPESLRVLQPSNRGAAERTKSETHNGPASWRVLLRNLDTDVSHHHTCIPVHTCNYSNSLNDAWSVSILSRLVAFVAPNQVQCLTKVIAQFLNQEHHRFSPRDDNSNPPKPQPSPISPQSVVSPIAVTHATDSYFAELSGGLKSDSKSSSSSSLHSQQGATETSIHCETHVISVELIDEDESGQVSSTVACIDLDPVLFSCKASSEITHNVASVYRTVVTWRGTCPSFRLEDRGIHTPDSRQVVVQTQDSWIGLHGSSSRLIGHDDMDMGLSVEGIVKIVDGHTTSSHQVALKRARVLISSQLHAALTQFFGRCVAHPSSDHNQEGAQQHHHHTHNTHVSSDEEPTAKLSILLVDPIVILLSTGEALGGSMFQVRADSIKGSLLFSHTGQLSPGSIVKIRNGHLFLLWKADRLHQSEQETEPETLDGLLTKRKTALDRYLNLSHHSNSLRSTLHRRDHRRRRRQNGANLDHEPDPEVESVLLVNSVTVRLPVGDQRHFEIHVPDVNVDTSLSTLKNAIHMSSRLDLGIPDERNNEVLCPELRIFVGDISAKVGILHKVVLALKLACDLVVEKNVESIGGVVKIAAEVHDEVNDTKDNFISPVRVQFDICVIEQLLLDITTEHFIRVTLSPLTARTLASIASTLSHDLDLESNTTSSNNDDYDTSNNESEILSLSKTVGPTRVNDPTLLSHSLGPSNYHANISNEQPNNARLQQTQPGQIELNVCFGGVIVNCLAEDPRVQILRLVLHDLKLDAVVPFLRRNEGALEFSFQDFVIEDTISWTLPWRHQESSNSEQWMKLVIGNHAELEGFRDLPFVSELHRLSTAFRGTAARHISAPLHRLSRRRSRMHSNGDGGANESNVQHRPNPITENNSSIAITPRSLRNKTSPLVNCVLKWVYPFDHIAAHLCIKGLDFNIDFGLLSSVVEWARSIGREFALNRDDDEEAVSVSPRRKSNHALDSGAFTISIDNAVIEPINIRVCVRAPSRRIQEDFKSWLLGKLLLNEDELLNGLEVQLPQVVFNGNFYNTDRVFNRIKALYLDSVTSALFGRQLIWQLPRVFKLTRVLGTSLLRRRSSDIFITRVESAALVSTGRRASELNRIGLLGLLERPRRRDQPEEHNDGNDNFGGIILRYGLVVHHLLLTAAEGAPVQSQAVATVDELSNVDIIDVTGQTN